MRVTGIACAFDPDPSGGLYLFVMWALELGVGYFAFALRFGHRGGNGYEQVLVKEPPVVLLQNEVLIVQPG